METPRICVNPVAFEISQHFVVDLEKGDVLEGWGNVKLVVLLVFVAVLSIAAQAFLILMPQDALWGPDGGTYLAIASEMKYPWDIFRGDLGDSRYWAIGYPLFLYSLSFIPGNLLLVSVIVQSVMLPLSAFFAYLMVQPRQPKLAVIVFVSICLSPTLLFGSRVIGYESLLMLLATVATYFGLRSRWTTNAQLSGIFAVSAGFTLGVATWVQAKIVVLLPIFVFFMFFRSDVKWKMKRAALLVAAYAVPATVLSVRNLVAFGRFTPLTDNAAVNLWIGNSPESSGRYQNVFFPEGWRDELWPLIIKFASEQPREFVTLQVRKLVELFLPTRERPELGSGPVQVAIEGLQFIWLSGLIVGFVLFCSALLWRLQNQITYLWPVALIVFTALITHVPFIAEARMRIPFEPLLMVVVVPTYALFLRRWFRSSSSRAALDSFRMSDQKLLND